MKYIYKIVKSHKKSYDSTSTTNANTRKEFRISESPSKVLRFPSNDNKEERVNHKIKDFKEFLYRGTATPSSNSLQASIMEKIMESKLRK